VAGVLFLFMDIVKRDSMQAASANSVQSALCSELNINPSAEKTSFGVSHMALCPSKCLVIQYCPHQLSSNSHVVQESINLPSPVGEQGIKPA
jgi:ATP-dependent phosphoenolpyruvate carboxykinase